MPDPTPTMQDVKSRLQARALELAKRVHEAADILWSNGPMTAQWEGGRAPTWDEVCADREAWMDRKRFEDMARDLFAMTQEDWDRLAALRARQATR